MTENLSSATKLRERCPGSGLIWEYSTPWLAPGMPICCPRCGQLVTLTVDRTDARPPYALPMTPEHEWEPESDPHSPDERWRGGH